MPRTRDLAVAAGFAIVVIFGAVFVAEIRAAIAAAFPGHARTIIGGSVVVMIGGASRAIGGRAAFGSTGRSDMSPSSLRSPPVRCLRAG